jgi:hypothetical protein
MRLVNLIEESFTEYKKPHMLLGFPLCSFKCDHEYGSKICQNSELARAEKIEIPVEDVVARYLSNDITKAIVLAGLEPFDSYIDVIGLLNELRSKNGCYDDVVIYTGYKPEELRDRFKKLASYKNVLVKFGRFIPGDRPHYDGELGINLASDNQFARWVDEAYAIKWSKL